MPDTDREIRKEYMKNYYKRKKKLNRFINCVKEFDVYHNQFALNLGNIKVFGFLKYQKNIFSNFFQNTKKQAQKT